MDAREQSERKKQHRTSVAASPRHHARGADENGALQTRTS